VDSNLNLSIIFNFEKKEMKKIEYQAPEMEVVKLRGPQVLLETSGEEAGGGGHGHARELGFDDEE